MFNVPVSSSPPSTPDRRNSNVFGLPNPSTTPAGPPPTSLTAASTTPAGPPPSSVFSGQQFNTAIPFPAGSTIFKKPDRTSAQPLFSGQSSGYGDYDDYDDEEDAEGEDDDDDLMDGVEGPDRGLSSDLHLNIPAIAKSLSSPMAGLDESDEIIMETERAIDELLGEDEGQVNEDFISESVSSLIKVWRNHYSWQSTPIFEFGPGKDATVFQNALFLSSLAMQIHHPPQLQDPRAPKAPWQKKTLPSFLVGWLQTYHNPHHLEFDRILNHNPSPSAHERFWDVVFSLALRGDLTRSARLLELGRYQFAITALDDGAAEPGYHGEQLEQVDKVIDEAAALLKESPSVKNNNWDQNSADWAIYRLKIQQTVQRLSALAEGESPLEEDEFSRSGQFGRSSMRPQGMSMSTVSRRAESKLPWAIYENLNYLYGQMLGARSEIMAASADWLEATIGMTIWSQSENELENSKNLASSLRSLSASRGPGANRSPPDYLELLKVSFRLLQEENEADEEMKISTTDPVQVGLACIFEKDYSGLLGILRGMSATISTAVVQVANLGGWLNETQKPSKGLMAQFDQSDLMVLNYAPGPSSTQLHDNMLDTYASLLAEKPALSIHNRTFEGWELAIAVLGRLEDSKLSHRKIDELFQTLELTTSTRVERATTLCARLGLTEQAHRAAQKYADTLSNSPTQLGISLYYYAKAHASSRIRSLIATLVSSSLIQSTAYPPTNTLDTTLHDLLTKPKPTLSSLAAVDRRAAQLLSTNLSGYATLRRFYDLRDAAGAYTHLRARPVARKRQAAGVLASLIASSADSIHGGLLDPEVESALPVDALLALLGEALMFVNQERRVLARRDAFILLRAVEDLSTVSPSISARCEEWFSAAVEDVHASAEGKGRDKAPRLIQGSTASLEGSSAFSLVNASTASSGELVRLSQTSDEAGSVGQAAKVERAWDWRRGLPRGAKSKDVLTILRLGLAREVAVLWTDDPDYGGVH